MEQNRYLLPPSPMMARTVPPANQEGQYSPQELRKRRRADLRALMLLRIIRQEIANTSDFKQHHIPLARVRKITRTNNNVNTLSTDALVIFEKACFLLISDLTIHSWKVAEYESRKILNGEHISSAASQFKKFDFLRGALRRDEVKVEAATGQATTAGTELHVNYDLPPVAGMEGCVADDQLPPANGSGDDGDEWFYEDLTKVLQYLDENPVP